MYMYSHSTIFRNILLVVFISQKQIAAQTDCIGSWSTCDASCKKTFTITTPKAGNGKACYSTNDEIECCTGGSCAKTALKATALTNAVAYGIKEDYLELVANEAFTTSDAIFSSDGKFHIFIFLQWQLLISTRCSSLISCC